MKSKTGMKTGLWLEILTEQLGLINWGWWAIKAWTWFCWGDGSVKSWINLVIFSTNLFPYFHSMMMDTNHEFSPARVKTKDDKMRLIHPDHFPLHWWWNSRSSSFRDLKWKRSATESSIFLWLEKVWSYAKWNQGNMSIWFEIGSHVENHKK